MLRKLLTREDFMYKPKPFDENNKEVQLKLIQDYPFATLISTAQNELFVSHIPMYLMTKDGKDYLVGHLAKANAHYQNLEGNGVAVFHGPHAYVSHTWYETANVVPTWNYISVHVTGKISITNAEGLASIINHMLHIHESGFAALAKNTDASLLESLMNQIVGFQLEIEKIEGKWKLSQNKSIETQQKIATQLSNSPDANARNVGAIMKENIK